MLTFPGLSSREMVSVMQQKLAQMVSQRVTHGTPIVQEGSA